MVAHIDAGGSVASRCQRSRSESAAEGLSGGCQETQEAGGVVITRESSRAISCP